MFRIELLCISTIICFVPVINVTFFESVINQNIILWGAGDLFAFDKDVFFILFWVIVCNHHYIALLDSQ